MECNEVNKVGTGLSDLEDLIISSLFTVEVGRSDGLKVVETLPFDSKDNLTSVELKPWKSVQEIDDIFL